MIEVCVRSRASEYRAIVGSGLLNDIGSTLAKQTAARRCAIVTDSNIKLRFGENIHRQLTSGGFQPALITVPPGEQSKTLEHVGSICDQMVAAGLDRQSFVIGLGGGVIGDLSGFVAAIYQRGIPHVQIPTTLLAMVDSSIGGKTGVNTRDGKNLIGATHHPLLVIDDVDLLETLPPRELRQGFAEMIKQALIADVNLFEDLRRLAASKLDDLKLSSLPETLVPLIRRNIEIKASIVAKDEFDRTGERAILNFGHTVGHGIERAGNYSTFLHGEAISLGMVAACDISIKRAGLPKEQRDAIVDLLGRFGLPTKLPADFPREKIFDALKFDKKFESGQVRFIVTPGIGSARLASDITLDDIREAVNAL